MHNLIVENHPKTSKTTLPRDIVRHLSVRVPCGRIAIVAENPQEMLASMKEQWSKVIDKLKIFL